MSTSYFFRVNLAMTTSQFIKKLSTTFVGTAFAALSSITAAQAISITPTNNGNDLVNEILGSGIIIPPDSINYTGTAGASGIFTNGLLSGIGIDSGIIITTGTATDAESPNDSDEQTTDNKLPGDSDLDRLIPGFFTEDATILEFEFESQGGDLYFNYVFASEEYVEWTNKKYNDVFAFFLNGENIALIPGTSTPVAINTVNGGRPLGTAASNPEFFNNNDLSEGGSFFDIEYDGFTNIFTAQALGLSPGSHRIRLAIADAGDAFYDSAVFIQANSFSDMLVDVPDSQSIVDVPNSQSIVDVPNSQSIVDVPNSQSIVDVVDAPDSKSTVDVVNSQSIVDVVDVPDSKSTVDVVNSQSIVDVVDAPDSQSIEDVPDSKSTEDVVDVVNSQPIEDAPNSKSTVDVVNYQSIVDVPDSKSIEDVVNYQSIVDVPDSQSIEDVVNYQSIEDVPDSQSIEDVVNYQPIEDAPDSKSTVDVPEPSVLIGLLVVGFAGSWIKKKPKKAEYHIKST